jgi:hypothetical protein
VGVARCAHQGICTLARLSMSAFTRRTGNFQFVVNFVTQTDGSTTREYSYVTYDNEENRSSATPLPTWFNKLLN